MKITLLLLVCVNSLACEESPVVETCHGCIKGSILKASHDPELQYYAFRGIPYAKPPLGKLRFQPPQEPDHWKGTKNTQEFGNDCPQIFEGNFIGDEDCLTLNVFTKNLSSTSLRPVLFWIHGGAHYRGSSSRFSPDYLMEKDVVLVTINFRLNVLGFLSTNDENAYGNNALKDQIAGLKWVQKNIVKFGGDPKKVTIFGVSSGSDDVSLLSLSPRTKGLFHQIINQSGSSLSPRYLQLESLKYTHRLANYFNISTATTKSIIEGLQKINYKELVEASAKYEAIGEKVTLEALPFFPIIEVNHPDAVIASSPYEILEEGKFEKLPFLMGHNSGEASLGFKIINESMDMDDFDAKPELFYTKSLNNPNKTKEIGSLIRERYLGKTSAKNNFEGMAKFLSQEIIVRGMRKDLEFRTKLGDGYYYIMSYKGQNSWEHAGAGHGEESYYLFKINPEETQPDQLHRRIMVELWTNFATFGNPTPKKEGLLGNVIWEKCNKTNLTYLDIGKDLKLEVNPEQDEYEFWKGVFGKFGNFPRKTY